jgi:hypothetical protein
MDGGRKRVFACCSAHSSAPYRTHPQIGCSSSALVVVTLPIATSSTAVSAPYALLLLESRAPSCHRRGMAPAVSMLKLGRAAWFGPSCACCSDSQNMRTCRTGSWGMPQWCSSRRPMRRLLQEWRLDEQPAALRLPPLSPPPAALRLPPPSPLLRVLRT